MALPETQKAWVVEGRGNPQKALVLKTQHPLPKVKADEVLVKVQAAALNPAGYKLMHLPRLLTGAMIAEFDFAGVIVDANGSKFNTGDSVWGLNRAGSLAEYISVPEVYVGRTPANTTPTEAAGLALAGQTAWMALFECDHLRSGQTVFINGGSSSVGLFAIQVAKAKGLKVWTSASGKNEELVRRLGADVFMDYTKRPLHEALMENPPNPPFDSILDAVALNDASLYINSPAYLAPGGSYVSTVPLPHAMTCGELSKTFNMYWNAFFRPTWLGGTRRRFTTTQRPESPARFQHFSEMVSDGSVKTIVDSVHEFDDVLNAYDRIMTSRAKGKVVVKVDPSVE